MALNLLKTRLKDDGIMAEQHPGGGLSVEFKPMSPDELERRFEAHQERFEANMERLSAKTDNIADGLIGLTGVVGRLTDVVWRLQDTFERHLREQHGLPPS